MNHPDRPILAKRMCSSCYQRQAYADPKNRKKYIANAKRWSEANKDKRKKIAAKSNATGAVKAYKSVWAMMNKYNLTMDAYMRLAKKQKNRCGICGTDEHVLNVDHNHTTGKVRGLLCNSCNRGLGFLGDSIRGVKRALSYLENGGVK